MSGVHPAIVGTLKPEASAHWLWTDETATQAFAQALAQQPSLQNAYIELVGDLGAGKTTFVRHLLKTLGVQGRIKSPTYAVVEPHEGIHPSNQTPLAIWHFDFYRFADPREWEDAGFKEIFASPGLKLVEWPEKAGAQLPTADLDITLHTALDGARQVGLCAHSATGAALLAATPLDKAAA